MKFLVFIPILFLSTAVFPQSSEVRSVKVNPDYTWRNSEYWERDSVYFDMPFIKNSSHEIHFRIYFPKQLIDLYSDDGVQFSGLITQKTTQYEKENTAWGEINESAKLFYQQIVIEDTLATRIADKIIESGQPEILTDAFIENWNSNYLHCSEIRFHFKFGKDFRPQKYSCPWGQDTSVAATKTIISNYDFLSRELKLESRFENFLSLLPKGRTYSNDGYRLIYLMTDTELVDWEEENTKSDYLKSIENKTTGYLENYLDNQRNKDFNLSCYADFWLIIGKDGYLKNIKILDYDKPLLSDGLRYFKEKWQIKNCEKILSGVFSDIDMSSFELEYEVRRVLMIEPNKEIIIQ